MMPVQRTPRIAPQAAVAALVAAVAIGQPAAAQDAASGSFLFFTFCTTCHGEDGRGDGPTAAVLTVRPTDLTALAAAEGGVFPTGRVIDRIEGTDPLIAHGTPMPIYAEVFRGDASVVVSTPDREIQTTAVVADLVAYLESIQD